MHWHIFPRRQKDTPKPGPVWKLDSTEMYNGKFLPSENELEELKKRLLNELNKLI